MMFKAAIQAITRPRAYITPEGMVWHYYNDMTRQNHVLVAGASGSGKSVVINGILHAVLHNSPARAGLILIDPKRVELRKYARLPHVVSYATEPGDIARALQEALEITDQRYKRMSRRDELTYSGPDMYVVVDELADIMTTNKRAVQPLLQRLCQIGRAAKVHVIAATQCPLASVIPTAIKVNFDAVVALRTRCAQDSRNIMGTRGCEDLPRFGRCYYVTPAETKLLSVPMVDRGDIAALIEWWTSSACIA